MKIEFDPLEMSLAQRQHFGKMIAEWPHLTAKPATGVPVTMKTTVDPSAVTVSEETSAKMDEIVRRQIGSIKPLFDGKTEAQLLAEEQQQDLAEHQEHQDNSDQAAAAAAFGGDVPERDANGLPWDHRIHSSSKARVADGSWRKMRGVDPALVATVEAELRALMAAPVAAADVPPPPAAAEPAAPAQVPPPPPAQAAAAALTSVTQAPADAPVTLDLLLTEIGQAIMHKVVSSAELSEVCQRHGVANTGLLVSRKDLVPQVAADFRALVASKGASNG